MDYDPGVGKGRSVPNSGGGDFISVHLRMADYVRARPGISMGMSMLNSVNWYGMVFYTVGIITK